MNSNRWYRLLVLAAVLGSSAVANAEELELDSGGDNPFGPTNQLSEAKKNDLGQTMHWECAGKCQKGDTCCRPIYVHP